MFRSRHALRCCCAAITLSLAPAAEFHFGAQTFTVPDGFVVELVAAPPLVERPISIDFDELGRLYVTDSSGSNEPVEKQVVERPHRVVRLEDADGDGRFDRSVVFADKLMFPEGAMWLDGSLYVAAPPSIWKFTDTDGDGVADQRSEWYQGKTLTHCANDLHGPYRGPDGWIYFCKGAFAEQKIAGANASRASHILRCRPDGTGLERVMTGGMDNPVGVVFTPTGERILSGTFFQDPAGGRRDGLIHALYGGVYGKQHDVLDGHARTGELLPTMTHLGPAAACGLARYKSRIFGAEYRDNLFACCFNLHKITRHVLVPDGATFTTNDSDFLVSDSTDFHPTDVREDADGSLLVVDTGGWYKICCPTSQLAKPDVRGAIYRVRRADAPRLADPRGQKILWSSAAPADIAALLGDERPAVRERAISRLAAMGVAAMPALAQTLRESAAVDVRRNAVWALTRIDEPAAREVARAALADKDASVRHAAAHSASVWRDTGAGAALRALLREKNPPLQRAAAEAFGRLGNPGIAPELLAQTAGAHDRALEHSLIFALIELGDRTAPLAALADANPRTHRAALIALDQMDGGALRPEQVLPLLTHDEPLLRETASWIFGHHAEWSDLLVPELRANFAKDGDDQERVKFLAHFAASPAFLALLAEQAGAATAPQLARLLALRVMARAGLREMPAAWADALTRALAEKDPAIRAETVRAVRAQTFPKTGAPALSAALREFARDTNADHDIRRAALAAVPGELGPLDVPTFAFLHEQLSANAPPLARATAATVLARASLTAEQLRALTSALPDAGPQATTYLLAAFARQPDETLGLAVLAALENPRAIAALPPATLQAWLAKFPPAVQQRGAALLARLGSDPAQQRAHLDDLAASLKDGDIRRGQAVFNAPRVGCVACHAIGYVGGNFGPDLTRIGQIRTERDLLEAVVFPSASFVRSYEPMVVATKTGGEQIGLLRGETPEEIVLATGPNLESHIARSEIVELRPGALSLMPPGFEQMLTRQELADLVAFLKATRW